METSALPDPIEAYFRAQNAHDIDAMSATFDENAIVNDEGQEYRGLSAIRAWTKEVTHKYHSRVEPQGVAYTNKQVVVSGLVSGNFPGSPILLVHTFTLSDTSIMHLVIE